MPTIKQIKLIWFSFVLFKNTGFLEFKNQAGIKTNEQFNGYKELGGILLYSPRKGANLDFGIYIPSGEYVVLAGVWYYFLQIQGQLSGPSFQIRTPP